MSEQVKYKTIAPGWFNEEFGAALRTARGKRSQASVAGAVKRQSGHISRVELGKTPLSLEEAVLLTKELPFSFSVAGGQCSVLLSEPEEGNAAVDPVEVYARYAETGRLPEDEGCSCVGVCAVTGLTSCYDEDTETKFPSPQPPEEIDSVFAVSEPGPDNRNTWKRLKDWWIGKEFISEPQPRISAPPSDPASS